MKMEKKNFVTIVKELDTYYNGDIAEAFNKLNIYENRITHSMDLIIDALDEEIDPKHYARNDDLTYDCGSYLCEWLFGHGEFQEKCSTAEELYDYIAQKYLTAEKEMG